MLAKRDGGSYRTGNQGANYLIHALDDLAVNNFNESWIRFTVTEKGTNNYLCAIARYKRGEYCYPYTLYNKGLTINASNQQGTIALGGVTEWGRVSWKAEVLNF